MASEFYAYVIIGMALSIIAITMKPLKKLMGFLIIILGAVAHLTDIGVVIGVLLVVIGSILLFTQDQPLYEREGAC